MAYVVVTRYGMYGVASLSLAAQVRRVLGGHVRKATKLELASGCAQ